MERVLPRQKDLELALDAKLAMHSNEPAVRYLRFGIFQADVQSGELTKQGRRVRLQEQPFRLLIVLLGKPGEVVTREELHSTLWPQTTVDFDHGLNKAISKIREALGDSSEHPRFIETVARRGYRFLADVAVIHDGGVQTVPNDAADEISQRSRLSVPSNSWPPDRWMKSMPFSF